MANYAPVAPITLLEKLESHDLLGPYNLLLVHDVLKHPRRYERLFKGRVGFVILDNSVIELGAPVTEGLLEAAHIVDADCIVLPDVLGKCYETIDVMRAFINKLPDEKRESVSWLGLPQGHNYEELVWCCQEISKLPVNVNYWGIPRWIANSFGSRVPIINHIGTVYPSETANIHLLGMSSNFNDDIRAVRCEGVMGIDSANPIVLGQHGRSIIYEYDHLDRGDYWDDTLLNLQAIRNIIQLRALLV